MDLVLNNPQRLIYHKNQPTNQPTKPFNLGIEIRETLNWNLWNTV